MLAERVRRRRRWRLLNLNWVRIFTGWHSSAIQRGVVDTILALGYDIMTCFLFRRPVSCGARF